MSSLKDKVPPHNLDAEQATLGALLLDWEALPAILQLLRPERFYSLQNQKIFSAMLDLYNQGVTGDIISLIEKLRSAGELEAAGGPAYISSLTDTVPTSANIEYYAEIVLDNSVRRELIKIAAKIVAESHDQTIESRAVLEEAQKFIFELTDINTTHRIVPTNELVVPTVDMIQNLMNDKKAYTGIPSGFKNLDKMTNGFQPSELIIIGARPSMGKTAMALTMLQHIAIDNKIPAAFFSLEMSNMQIIQRLLSQVSRIDSERLRTGYIASNEINNMHVGAGKIHEAPLFLVDSPNLKLLDLRALARRLRLLHKVEIIFIDYITLIQNENVQIPRHEQIANISRSLKSLARELQIPVVALSQVGRGSEGKQPTLADLRESGSIEQDADVVMFIHRERETEKNVDSRNPTDAELMLAKQRNGPTGLIKLVFIPAYTKFENRDSNT